MIHLASMHTYIGEGDRESKRVAVKTIRNLFPERVFDDISDILGEAYIMASRQTAPNCH